MNIWHNEGVCEYRIITPVDTYSAKNIPCYKDLKFKELFAKSEHLFAFCIFERENYQQNKCYYEFHKPINNSSQAHLSWKGVIEQKPKLGLPRHRPSRLFPPTASPYRLPLPLNSVLSITVWHQQSSPTQLSRTLLFPDWLDLWGSSDLNLPQV